MTIKQSNNNNNNNNTSINNKTTKPTTDNKTTNPTTDSNKHSSIYTQDMISKYQIIKYLMISKECSYDIYN